MHAVKHAVRETIGGYGCRRTRRYRVLNQTAAGLYHWPPALGLGLDGSAEFLWRAPPCQYDMLHLAPRNQ